jgi:hypothetical protein
MYLGFHVKYPLLLLDFYETWIFWTDFREKLIKFNKSPSSGNRVVQVEGQKEGRTDGRTDSQTDKFDEANSRLLQCCKRTYKLLFLLVIPTTVK